VESGSRSPCNRKNLQLSESQTFDRFHEFLRRAHNRNKVIDRNEAVTEPLSDFEKRFIRLGALLHDIGHIAAGHTVEDELEPNSLTYGG